MFTTDAYHIGHGVNTVGMMGAGVAKIVRQKFPAVYDRYRAVCTTPPGMLPGGVLSVLSTWPGTNRGVWVHNLSSQDLPGTHARVDWLAWSLDATLLRVYHHGAKKLAIPRIGAGIGGLDWETQVLPVFEKASAQYPDIELEVWYL